MKKLSAFELTTLGKQISKEYIEGNTPLTDSLVKVANEQGLNAEQTKRVAEAANIETYLALTKTAGSHYIEFPLADSSVVFKPIEKVASLDECYEDINPLKDKEFSLDFEGQPGFEKKAEYTSIVPTVAKIQEYEKNIVDAVDVLYTEKLAFDSKLSKLANYVKTEIIQGTDFADIKGVFEKVATFSEPFLNEFVGEYKYEFLNVDFTKQASEFEVDTENELAKQILSANENIENMKKLATTLDRYIDSYETLLEEHNLHGLNKTAGIVSSFIGTIVQHPILSTVAIGLPLAYMVGKRRGGKEKQILNSYTASLAMPNKLPPPVVTV